MIYLFKNIKSMKDHSSSAIEMFCDSFHQGPEKVLEMIEGRFLNDNPEENFGEEEKVFFVEAARKLFKGETNVDRITIKELEFLFKTNETLIGLQKQFGEIEFQQEYSSKNLTECFFRLFKETAAITAIKDFILNRFLNKDSQKNLNKEEQKICFECAESVISGKKTSKLIGKNDIKKFKKLFSEDVDLVELQKLLEKEVVGETNDDSSTDSDD